MFIIRICKVQGLFYILVLTGTASPPNPIRCTSCGHIYQPAASVGMSTSLPSMSPPASTFHPSPHSSSSHVQQSSNHTPTNHTAQVGQDSSDSMWLTNLVFFYKWCIFSIWASCQFILVPASLQYVNVLVTSWSNHNKLCLTLSLSMLQALIVCLIIGMIIAVLVLY